MTGSQSFAVYLTDEARPGAGNGPLQADALDFYDSGVWVTHGSERDFFPYGRVLRIRETDQPTGERRDASGGSAGAVDKSGLDVE